MVARAAAAGLDAIALTDHDTIAGIAAAAAALPPGLSLISGMELSCRRDGHSVHLLGYLFDPEHEELAAQTRAIRASRVERAKDMVAKLNELGVPVTWEQVTRIAGDGVIGRPHIARAMIEAGVVSSVDEAFTPRVDRPWRARPRPQVRARSGARRSRSCTTPAASPCSPTRTR